MLGGWWDLRYSGGALAGSVRLDGCLCLCVLKKEEEDEEDRSGSVKGKP